MTSAPNFRNNKLATTLLGLVFQAFCLAANVSALIFLALLLGSVFFQGAERISWEFLTSNESYQPEKTGIFTGLAGTLWLMLITSAAAIPMGVGAAIYLNEYEREGRVVRIIKLNIQNLAGVPSIIYGILGFTLFVSFMGLGQSVLAGALTMSLLILPIITIAAQEALQAVPESFRLAGYGIGLTRWQVVRHMILPVALPGMLTGVILALSRAIGETAPLIVIGVAAYVAHTPTGVLDDFTVMPMQIYNWTSQPDDAFREAAAAGIISLLSVLLLMNAAAIYLRYYFRNKLKGLGQ